MFMFLLLLQLDINNADLDREMVERAEGKHLKLNVRQLNHPNGNSISRNEGQKQCVQPTRDLQILKLKVNHEETEHMKMYKKIMKYFELLGIFFGAKLQFDWKPFSHFFVYVTSLFLLFAWFSAFFTHYKHFQNGESIRQLEVCAVYGLGISVI